MRIWTCPPILITATEDSQLNFGNTLVSNNLEDIRRMTLGTYTRSLYFLE